MRGFRMIALIGAALALTATTACNDDSAGVGGSTGYVDEGSATAPLDITSLLPYSGQVSRSGASYYRVTGMAADGIYTITLDRAGGLPYQVVPDAAGLGGVACGWNDPDPGASIDCPMRASAAGVLDFRVSGDDSVGGAFSLSVSAGGVVNEGSPNDPVVIDSYPFDGTALVQSYYLLTDLAPGGAYAIEFTAASAPVALFVFPDSTYQQKPDICSSRSDVGSSCNVPANGSGRIYLMTNVQQDTCGVSYTISVAAAPLANEGSQDDPVDVTAELPYAGMVHLLSSWYIINGLVPGSPYTVTLSAATDDVYLYLYGPGWQVPGGPRPDCQFGWANGGGNPIACVSKADASGRVRIEVRGFATADGATFTLAMAAGGIPNEGYYGAPVDITGAGGTWSGTIYNGPSSYMMSGRAAGTDYTVTISALTADLGLWVYDSGDYSNLLGSADHPGTANESCVVRTTTGQLHIRVTAASSVRGATFHLSVTP